MVTKMPGRVALHKTNEREQPDTKQGEHLTLKKRNQDGNREHHSEGRTTLEEFHKNSLEPNTNTKSRDPAALPTASSKGHQRDEPTLVTTRTANRDTDTEKE